MTFFVRGDASQSIGSFHIITAYRSTLWRLFMAAISCLARLDKGRVGDWWGGGNGADGARIKEVEAGRRINIWMVMEITSQ